MREKIHMQRRLKFIQMALHDKDKERASKRLQQYVEKEWIKGHNDLDWKMP